MQKHFYWGYCAGKPAQQGSVMGDVREDQESPDWKERRKRRGTEADDADGSYASVGHNQIMHLCRRLHMTFAPGMLGRHDRGKRCAK
jgi:hypothetical protein